MAFGLQLFNSSGNTILDVSSRLPRVVLSGTTGSMAMGASTNIYSTGFDTSDSWLVIVTVLTCDLTGGMGGSYLVTPNSGYFNLKNTTVNSFGGTGTGACTYSYLVLNL